jgi:hypothetical protein
MQERFISAVVAVLVLGGAVSAWAGGKKNDEPDRQAPRKHLVWLVERVNADSVILARNDRSATTNLAVTAETQVFVNGPLGKLSSVQPGMRGEFTATDTAVTRLAFFDYTPPEEKASVGKPAKAPKPVNAGRNKQAK